ncbi:hypothetical protein PMAYCL1PPCAC_18179, partial [Pristionchus mayeri]
RISENKLLYLYYDNFEIWVILLHSTVCIENDFDSVKMDLRSDEKRGELYKILGCDETSSKDQILTEYRVRAREMHPDKSGDQHNKIAFLQVQEAMAVLGDEVRRSRYNEWIHSPLPLTFDQFEKNIDTVKQSTHWATVPTTPMISGDEKNNFSHIGIEGWNKNRYQSDSARKFRDYQI